MKKLNIFQKLFNPFSTSNIISSSPPAAAAASKKHVVVVVASLGLPEPLLYYLKKNAKPKILLKLMKTSKYFFFKEFPFLRIHYPKLEENNQWFYYDKSCNLRILENFDENNLFSKPLWITYGIHCLATDNPKMLSNLLSKAVVCDIENFYLKNQILSFNDFKFMISKNDIKKVVFYFSHVEYSNGTIIAIDEIIKYLSKVKKFCWVLDPLMASTINHKMTKKLIANIDPFSLAEFDLINIPETFDFKLFSKFMKKTPLINYFLLFDDNISKKCSKMLQKFVNKLIKNASKKYFPIQIIFPRQTPKSLEALQKNFQIYYQQKQQL